MDVVTQTVTRVQMDEFQGFTDEVRTALAKAREQSIALHHAYIGTEHILLGLLDTETAVPVTVFRRLGIDPAGIRAAVLSIVKHGSGVVTGSDLPFTNRAKRAFEESMAEARDLSQEEIGTGHLLAGLIREEGGLAGQVLGEFGVNLVVVRDALLARGEEGSLGAPH